MFSKQNKIGLGGIGLGCFFLFFVENMNFLLIGRHKNTLKDKQTLAWGVLSLGFICVFVVENVNFHPLEIINTHGYCIKGQNFSESTMEHSQMFVPQQSCHRQPVKLYKNGTLFLSAQASKLKDVSCPV